MNLLGSGHCGLGQLVLTNDPPEYCKRTTTASFSKDPLAQKGGSQAGDMLQKNKSVYDKYFIGINEKFCSAGAWFMRHYFPNCGNAIFYLQIRSLGRLFINPFVSKFKRSQTNNSYVKFSALTREFQMLITVHLPPLPYLKNSNQDSVNSLEEWDREGGEREVQEGKEHMYTDS